MHPSGTITLKLDDPTGRGCKAPRINPLMKHFPEIQLTFEETRVLGCLLEKEILTPDAYPLSLNSLVTACNQSSSRYPVTDFDAGQVLEALRLLSEKYLVEKVLGGRTTKYEHCLKHILSLQDRERAIFTVLLLRGAQTAGELKQRCERIHLFDSLDEIEETLSWFIEYPHGPLVRRIAAGGARRVETFEHLLSADTPDPGPPEFSADNGDRPADHADPPLHPGDNGWQEAIEGRLARLEEEVMTLRSQIRTSTNHADR